MLRATIDDVEHYQPVTDGNLKINADLRRSLPKPQDIVAIYKHGICVTRLIQTSSTVSGLQHIIAQETHRRSQALSEKYSTNTASHDGLQGFLRSPEIGHSIREDAK